MIEEGKTYTCDMSAIAITILEIIKSDSEYIEVKGMVFNKKNKIAYGESTYSLSRAEIADWVTITL